MKPVHLFDPLTGDYLGPYEAQESPLEEGAYIEPEFCTDAAPPAHSANEKLAWKGNKWVIVAVPPKPLPAEVVLTIAEQIQAIEREAMLPRAVREFMLGVMEDKAIAVGAARTPPLTAAQSIQVLRAGNIGYRKVKEQDEQIVTLRAAL